MSVFPVVTFLLFVIAAVGADGSTEADTAAEAEAKLPKKPFTNLLTFTPDDYIEAFKSLDVNNDGLIKIDDLKSYYYHVDSEFAIQKFMQLIDTTKSPGVIDLEEFIIFMNKEQVKSHSHEITIAPSLETRQRYYADKILIYVYLVLDENAINSLFDAIESPDHKDGRLDIEEIKDMQVNILNDKSLKLTDLEAKLVLREIGGGSETISKEDFKEYLLGADISFLFRECRVKLTSNRAEYNNGCLVRKLVRYTTTYLTEYMRTLLFDAIDAQDKDQIVSLKDIREAFGCIDMKARQFMWYINGGKKFKLSYGDLRPLIINQAIKTHLEKECSKKDLVEKVKCLKWSLFYLINKNFFPKYTAVPDLDILFLFEDLDTSNDGTIQPKEDLEDGKHWNHDLAQKFMDEVEPEEEAPDNAVPKEAAPSKRKESVNLDDFFFFMYQPYMMCATGECQVVKDNNEKLACYYGEMEDMINYFLKKKDVVDFFKFYQTDIIYDVTLKNMGMQEQEIKNYLDELGQGDHYVTPDEFMYYVKQQEPSHLFVTDETVSPKNHLKPEMLHKKLLHYLHYYMTEYDAQMLFWNLDTDRNRVIDKKDLEEIPDLDVGLFESMAVYGNKEHVTILEFWLFLNTKAPGKDEPRKRVLENVCAVLDEQVQLKCFESNLKLLKENPLVPSS